MKDDERELLKRIYSKIDDLDARIDDLIRLFTNQDGQLDKELIEEREKVCRQCMEIGTGMGPSHNGSKGCESGSIASGGTRAHCTCDVCF